MCVLQNDMNWRQGALFLLDPIGGTGKTYFVTKVTSALFGSNRIGAFKLKNLQNGKERFETSRFVDKSLMIDDDASGVQFKDDDVFKALSGGGLSPIERKGVDGSEYRVTAKMIINLNQMPVFNNSGAITRRLHIIKTVAPFASAEEIKMRDNLFPEDELMKEIPSLATFAIEMYQKAVEEDWDIIGNIADDIVATDPFVDWFKTMERGEYKGVELYERYVEHYHGMEFDDKYDPISKNSFGRKMANYATKINRRDGKYYKI